MVEALSIIEAVHKDAMDINNFNTMKSRKDELVQRFRHLNHALLGKAPTAPSHSTSVSDPKNGNISNLSIITGMGPPTIQPAEAKAQIVVQPQQLYLAVTTLDSNGQTQGTAEPPTPAMVYHTAAPPFPSTAQGMACNLDSTAVCGEDEYADKLPSLGSPELYTDSSTPLDAMAAGRLCSADNQVPNQILQGPHLDPPPPRPP